MGRLSIEHGCDHANKIEVASPEILTGIGRSNLARGRWERELLDTTCNKELQRVPLLATFKHKRAR